MSVQLALVDGDFVDAAHGLGTVSGAPKIRQDLALWMSENLGTDRFHPSYGSALIRYIGEAPSDMTDLQIQTEVARVIRSYISQRSDMIQQDILGGARSTLTSADLISSILDVSVSMDFDKIKVVATLLTQSGEQLTIGRTVTSGA